MSAIESYIGIIITDQEYTIQPTEQEPKKEELLQNMRRIVEENLQFNPDSSFQVPSVTVKNNLTYNERSLARRLFGNSWNLNAPTKKILISDFSSQNKEFSNLVVLKDVLDFEKTKEKLEILAKKDPSLCDLIFKLNHKIHLGETISNLKKYKDRYIDQVFVYTKEVDVGLTIDNFKKLSEEEIYFFIEILIKDNSLYEPLLEELFDIFKGKMSRASNGVLSNKLLQLALEHDIEFIYTYFLRKMKPREESEKDLMDKNNKYLFKNEITDFERRENALTLAVDKSFIDLVEILIEKNKFSPRQKVKSFPQSILAYAASRGNLEMCKKLVELGARVDDLFEQEPLFIAACNRQEEVVAFLLEKGASVSIQGLYGSTPLSILFSNQELVEISSLNPLEIKMIEARVNKILKLLLDREDNRKKSRERQNCAFQSAVKGRYLEAVKTFLTREYSEGDKCHWVVDLNEIDEALVFARKANYKDIEEYLNQVKEDRSKEDQSKLIA